MNFVLIAVLILLLFGILNGFRKGMIRAIFSTFIIFAALAVASYGAPHAAKLLKKTPIYTTIEKQVEQAVMAKVDTGAEQVTSQIDAINGLPFPDSIKKGLIDNNNSQIYEAMGINDFAAYVSDYISLMILNAIAFVLLFFAAFIILKIIEVCLDLVSKLPVLHGINKIGGALFGLLNGLMSIWFFCIVLTLFSSTSWGTEIFRQINDSALLSMIYNHNYFLAIVVNVGKMLF